METLIIAVFADILEFMGVTIGGLFVALVVLYSVFRHKQQTNKSLDKQDEKMDKLYNLVREVQIDQAALRDRVEMHASHFDVVDNTVSRSERLALKAAEIAIEANKPIHSKNVD